MASAASTLALKKPSSVPLRTGLPRISPMRCSRRASPRKTKNTGAIPIHGMAGKQLADRGALLGIDARAGSMPAGNRIWPMRSAQRRPADRAVPRRASCRCNGAPSCATRRGGSGHCLRRPRPKHRHHQNVAQSRPNRLTSVASPGKAEGDRFAEQRRRESQRRQPRFETVHRQLHTGFAKPWNWHRPEQCQSWLLRSPGILSRRAPCGFLPLGRQLLDQPSRWMRNPSHQLNAENWSKGHARSVSRAGAASKAQIQGRSFCQT